MFLKLIGIMNILVFFSNAFLVGHVGKMVEQIEDKLVDMAMVETKILSYEQEEKEGQEEA